MKKKVYNTKYGVFYTVDFYENENNNDDTWLVLLGIIVGILIGLFILVCIL